MARVVRQPAERVAELSRSCCVVATVIGLARWRPCC